MWEQSSNTVCAPFDGSYSYGKGFGYGKSSDLGNHYDHGKGSGLGNRYDHGKGSDLGNHYDHGKGSGLGNHYDHGKDSGKGYDHGKGSDRSNRYDYDKGSVYGYDNGYGLVYDRGYGYGNYYHHDGGYDHGNGSDHGNDNGHSKGAPGLTQRSTRVSDPSKLLAVDPRAKYRSSLGKGKGKGTGTTSQITDADKAVNDEFIDRVYRNLSPVDNEIDSALYKFSEIKFRGFSQNAHLHWFEIQDQLASEPWCSKKILINDFLDLESLDEKDHFRLLKALRGSNLFSEIHRTSTKMFYDFLVKGGFPWISPTSYSVGISVFIGINRENRKEESITIKFYLHKDFFECAEYLEWIGTNFQDCLPKVAKIPHPIQDPSEQAICGDLWNNRIFTLYCPSKDMTNDKTNVESDGE